MKYFTDKKNWTIAVVESAGIFLFNLLFIPSFYSALGEIISTVNVVIVSGGLFVLRVLWFYVMLLWRLLWGQHEKKT